MKLQLGLLGLGPNWDQRYRPALKVLSDRFQVTAICEQVFHRAQQVAGEFGAVAVEGYQALARRSDVDAMLLLDSQWYGSLPILSACDAGKAVFCTWGLDSDPAQAQRIRQRIEESGIAFMAEFSRRCAPATLRLKELIATRLGQPQLLFCHYRAPAQTPPPPGRLTPPQGPGLDRLVELVDWCRYVVGADPSYVTAVNHRGGGDADRPDYEMMSLDFSPPDAPGSGAVAQISNGQYVSSTWPEAVTFRPPAALQVACQRGIAFIDLPATVIWFDQAGRHLETLDSERPLGETLLSQFHRAVTSFVRNAASLHDAWQALRIVEEARTSYREGHRRPLFCAGNGK